MEVGRVMFRVFDPGKKKSKGKAKTTVAKSVPGLGGFSTNNACLPSALTNYPITKQLIP